MTAVQQTPIDETIPGVPATAAHEHHDNLRDYYEDTWFDYRFLWLDPRNRALHFGYEQPGQRRHGESLLALNHVMAEHVRLRRGAHVLDAGCGVGGTSMWLAEEYGAEVVGVNLVEDHIERARRYGRERHLAGQVRFEVADYTATPLAPHTFDVVWAQESACHAPDKSAFTREAARVLRSGGRLVMAEYLVSANRRPAFGSDPISEWERGWEMTLATEADWREALTAAGFVNIEFDDVTRRMRRSLRRLNRLCRLLQPIAQLLHTAKIRTDAQQGNIAGSLAMWQALERGDWFYAIVTAETPVSSVSSTEGEQ